MTVAILWIETPRRKAGLHIWMQAAFYRLTPILPCAPIYAGSPLCFPSLGEFTDAVLEQLGHGQTEEVGDFPQVFDLRTAFPVDDFANPRFAVTAPCGERSRI